MNITPLLFLTCWNSTQFGSTELPETLSEYVWYAGGEIWKGPLMVADLEWVDKIEASEFHDAKLKRERDDLTHIGDNSQNRRCTIQNFLEEIRFWEHPPRWKPAYPERREVQEDLLGESDGLPPTTKARSHCTSVCNEISEIVKIASKNVGDLSWTSSTRRLTPRVLPQACPLQRPWHLQGKKLIIQLLKLVYLTSQDICVKSMLQDGETCVLLKPQKSSCWLTQPIKQCRSKRVSEQKLNSWQARWDLWRFGAGGMLIRTVNKFSLSLCPSASDSPVNTKSESQTVPLTWWTEQRPRTGETCNWRLLIRLHRMEQWWQVVFSSEANKCTPELKCSGALLRCAPTFFCASFLCLRCRFRLQSITIHCKRRRVWTHLHFSSTRERPAGR